VADAGAESARSEALELHCDEDQCLASRQTRDEDETFRAPVLAVLISSLESPRRLTAPVRTPSRLAPEVPSNLSVPRPP